MRTTTDLFARFNLVGPSIDFDNLDNYYDDEGNFVIPDVLDFATVPFESVEADLAEELFEQDLAEDREREDHVCCAKCGREEDGWNEQFTYVAYQFLCPCCEPKTREDRLAFRELNFARAMRIWEKKLAAANQFREAVRKAKFLRPDLNWERYDHDRRGHAGPRPFFGWM